MTVAPTPAEIPGPEFSRPLRVADLPRDGLTVKEKATDAERTALAARYGVRAVRRLTTEARLRPEGRGWRLTGVARARLTLACGVTLQDVDQILEEPLDRTWLPGIEEDTSPETEMEEEDGPERLGQVIDAGEVAAEAVALAIDPWPRAPGVVFEGARAGPPGTAPLTDEAARPFAGLAALRARLEQDD